MHTMNSNDDGSMKNVRPGLFGIDYDTWCSVVEGFVESAHRMESKKEIQLYPFSKLERSSVMALRSQEFFNEYIKSGSIALFDSFWFKTRYHKKRSDGSLRDIAQISPMMFLILESFGIMIHSLNKSNDDSRIKSHYNSDYDSLNFYFGNQYNLFSYELNEYVGKRHYLKTDIMSFYPSIDLDILFNLIKKMDSENTFSPMTLTLYEEIFRYLGKGNYPTVERSTTLSYLAVKVLLYEIDKRLADKLSDLEQIKEFNLIRYEDDMYVVFSLHDDSEDNLKNTTRKIIWNYSSILSEYGLTLNVRKSKLLNDEHPQIEWTRNNYDDSDESTCDSNSNECLSALIKHLTTDDKLCASPDDIKEFVSDYLESKDNNSSRLLNGILFSEQPYSDEIISQLNDLIINNFDFISVEPKLFTKFILKTDDVPTINNFLNKLHEHSIKKDWNTHYSIAATTYLMDNEFKKSDLEKIMYAGNPYFKYCSLFCVDDFYLRFINKSEIKIPNIMNPGLSFLYSAYMIKLHSKKQFSAFAFYYVFFESISKQLIHIAEPDCPTYASLDYEAYLLLYGKDNDEQIKRMLKMKNINRRGDMASLFSISNNEIIETIDGLKSMLQKRIQQFVDEGKI